MTVIRTQYDPKPGPCRDYYWTAHWNDWDLGAPFGMGKTETEAMQDLIDNHPVEEIRPGGMIEWIRDDDIVARKIHFHANAAVRTKLSKFLFVLVFAFLMVVIGRVIF